MWLINTRELYLKDFIADVPKYGILSHRWTNDEISHKDFQKQRNTTAYGYEKIKAFCNVALQQKLEWVWVDSVCIDKKSSAELQEAINSMYSYYSDSAYCFVHLSDVIAVGNYDTRAHFLSAFQASSWFTRGWTLQELLAPRQRLGFWTRDWQYIGSKKDLQKEISAATNIPVKCMFYTRSAMQHVSIARKMSWAAQRVTTRQEDRAYSLLGLFDVNMPLLYGEGMKAFIRLQLEIIRKTSDDSIFAWTRQEGEYGMFYAGQRSMLAPSPKCFINSGEIRQIPYGYHTTLLYSMCNAGLELRTCRTVKERLDGEGQIVNLPLRCYAGADQDDFVWVTLILRDGTDIWERRAEDALQIGKVSCQDVVWQKPDCVDGHTTYYVRQTL